MAANESPVPEAQLGKGFFTQLLNDVNTGVTNGLFQTTDTIAQAILNITNEQSKH